MQIKTIIIANIAEAFESIIGEIKFIKQKKERLQTEHSLCDRALLWGEDNKIVITPFIIPEKLLRKNIKLLKFKNVKNISPRKINISLSDAIRLDKKLLSTLCNIIQNNPGVKISPYCVTKKFLALAEYFKIKKLNFVVQERPSNSNDWLISYLDSKVGSRMIINEVKDLNARTPQSLVCRTKDEAIEAVHWFWNNNCPCILKANFGESGWGLIPIKKNLFKNKQEVTKHIKKEFQKDSIWNRDLILVEEYIQQKKLISRSPSVEVFLSEKSPKVTYICNQILNKKGNFLGVVLGKNSLPTKLKTKLTTTSLEIGKKFWNLGYRGFFDIDFIISRKGSPYVIETNTRRTGGTHVYDVVKTIFGKDWEQNAFVMSQDNFYYGKNRLDEQKILDKMKKILYPINGRKEGAIISIVSQWQPFYGFIIVGSSQKRVSEIHKKMLNIWKIKN